MQSYKVVLSTSTELLGTAPNNPAVYSDFIVSKRMAEGKFTPEEIEKAKQEELGTLPVAQSDDEKGVTVFRRHEGALVLPDFMIRGFLKSAAASMSEGWGMSGKIDRLLHVGLFDKNSKFVADRFIPLVRDGEKLTEPDGLFDRPLRAMTAQGERISLASSELVRPVVTLSFHLTVLPLAEKGRGVGTKEKPMLIDQALLEQWFSYGAMSGLGQFRNGSFGRFDASITAL